MSELECNLKVEQSQSQSMTGPRIEFKVVLPYSLDGFNEVVQDSFKIAIAAAARAGCKGTCNITKTEVVITRIKETAAIPGARRRLYAAADITVGVGILLPDAQAGNLMVGALTMDAINVELTKQGVQQISKVTSRLVLFSSSSNNQTRRNSSSSHIQHRHHIDCCRDSVPITKLFAWGERLVFRNDGKGA
jgi:hypothetical protein